MSRTHETGTCVILVCVTNKQNRVLTHDKFFKIFSSFGKILRILIFERAVIWKTFVEYDNVESANQARMTMNGTDFGDEAMKMNVYASQLQRITFQENNSGGVDYTILRQKIEEKNTKQPKSYSSTTSPLYSKPSPIQQKSYTQSHFAQSPSMMYHQPAPTPLVNHNFEMIQHQISLFQSMQLNQQRVNQLMFLLQQVSSEQQYQAQIQYTHHHDYNYQLLDRQQQIAKELQEVHMKVGLQIEQYHQLLNQWQSMWVRPESYPQLGSISESNSSAPGSIVSLSPLQKQVPQQAENPRQQEVQFKRNVQNPWANGSPQREGGNIQFIKSYDGDSTSEPQAPPEVEKQLDQVDEQEAKQSDEEAEDREQALQIAKEMEELLRDGDNYDMFTAFSRDQPSFDPKQIMSKLNVELRVDESMSVLAMLETHIQQNSNQKSTNSVEQIDQLIEKSRQKQGFMKSQPYSLSLYSANAGSPDWSKEQVQLYEDVTENSDPAEYVNPLFLKVLVVRKSKVIYARWFDKKIVTLKMLYNIFSTYGNIDKMIYLKERSSALIQYQTLEHATMAKESLNDVMFYGQQIKIFYSNYEEIYLKSVDKDEQEEYFQGGEDTNRFKEGHTYSFNPPSETLMINNLTKESCVQEIIYRIFQPTGRILKHKQPGFRYDVRFVFHPSNRNSCSLKYESIETSLIILANLNGIQLDGRTLLLSFSKVRL